MLMELRRIRGLGNNGIGVQNKTVELITDWRILSFITNSSSDRVMLDTTTSDSTRSLHFLSPPQHCSLHITTLLNAALSYDIDTLTNQHQRNLLLMQT